MATLPTTSAGLDCGDRGMQVYLHVHEPYIVQVNGWALALKFCT